MNAQITSMVDPRIAWGQMLGIPTRPGDPDRPPAPTTLGLNRQVKAHIRLQREAPRKFGFHPSELPRLCPVLHRMMEIAREDLASDDSSKVEAAFSFLQRVVDAKKRQFSPDIRMEFRGGDAIHTETQYRLGVVGKLWGRWKCAHCHAVTAAGWMPRVLVDDINGDPLHSAAPCVNCNGVNMRENAPWIYIEPRVESDEWDVVGRADGDLRVKHDEWWYRYILEVKSINRAGFEGKRGPIPRPEHITQASIYGWMMGVSHIVFVYVCKDALSRWKEFVIPVDSVAVADAQNKINAVRKSRGTGKLPFEARACPNVQDERAKKCPGVRECFGCEPSPNFWGKD